VSPIALDRVHRDAELAQFFGTHVAAGTGAKEDDVLQARALARDRGRELRMVDDSDPGPCQRNRDRLAANIRMPVDRERYVDRPQEFLRHVAKRRVGIHEHRTQC